MPFGTKAFVPALLEPDRDEEEEVVNFTNDKEAAKQITRTQALDLLQDEMDRVSNRKKAPKQTPTRHTTTTNVLPYFEIREEIDATGKEVKAEAVNVTQHLEYLRQHPEMVQEESLPPPVTASSDEPGEEIPVSNLKSLSDGEYDALSARLEELARLEETEMEEPVPKVMKKSNSKTTRSSGWSKGFLNNTKKKKSPADNNNNKVVSEEVKKSAEVQNSNGPSKQVAHEVTSAPSTSKPISKSVFSGVIQERESLEKPNKVPVETSAHRVRFGDQPNEIREIPRIGQTPVASIARPPSRPIVGAGSVRQELQSQRQQQVPKKKLSRFAMERQQLNQ